MNRPFLRAACAALALLTAVLPLAACKRKASDTGPAAPQQTEAPDTTSEPLPAEGGRLRMAMPENLSVGNENYDPMLVSTEEALQLFSLVYEPLIAVDESGSLIPCLAVNWSAAENRPNCWTVNLRSGVRFHSGAALTADDVIYSFEHLGELGGSSYYAKCLSSIKSIERIDSSTVLVTAVSPGMINLYGLNFPIVRRDAAPFNGTGPYKVTGYSDQRVSMAVNAGWWDRPPYIQSVEFLARDSNETALASYSAGQLDFVPTALLSAGQYGNAGVTVVRDYMTQGMEVLLFNHGRNLPSNADFRRAVSCSINRSRIISNVYMNRARSSDVPVPPDSWLYSGAKQIDYDLVEAERLLDQLGCRKTADGTRRYKGETLELTLLVSATTENTTRADAAAIIASQLEQVGIKVNTVTASHGYGQQDSEFLTALRGKDWDIELVGFNLSQSCDLAPYLTRNGKNNFGGYSADVFDSLLSRAASAPDEETLRAVYYEIQSEFVDRLPFIVLYFRLNSAVARADISGIDALREPALLRNIKNWYIIKKTS